MNFIMLNIKNFLLNIYNLFIIKKNYNSNDDKIVLEIDDKNECEKNVITKFADLPSYEIKRICTENAYNYANLSLNIHSNLNIGNMIRSSNLCGCKKFIIFGRRHFDKRSAVGSTNYIEIERINGVKNGISNFTTELKKEDYILDENIFIKFIEDNNYLPIFVEQDSSSIIANEENLINIIKNSIEINKMPLFIYGNEHFGIPKNILDTRNRLINSYTIELSQMGAIKSFNVSNTLSIITYKTMEAFSTLHNLNT
jgi:tRNA G18 (ribose-2'-O)-methylase SpoU